MYSMRLRGVKVRKIYRVLRGHKSDHYTLDARTKVEWDALQLAKQIGCDTPRKQFSILFKFSPALERRFLERRFLEFQKSGFVDLFSFMNLYWFDNVLCYFMLWFY